MCVCVPYLFRTFSGINTDRVKTSSPHENRRPVLMQRDLISGVLVNFRIRYELSSG